jgi:hypothetical protein
MTRGAVAGHERGWESAGCAEDGGGGEEGEAHHRPRTTDGTATASVRRANGEKRDVGWRHATRSVTASRVRTSERSRSTGRVNTST